MGQAADREANHALRARFSEVYGQYERLRSGLDDMQQRLSKVQVSAKSDDGFIAATVGPRGQLIHLRLDPRVYRDYDADALAKKITATVQQATDSAAAAVQEVVGGYLPAGTGAMDYLKDGDFGSLLRRSDASVREATDD